MYQYLLMNQNRAMRLNGRRSVGGCITGVLVLLLILGGLGFILVRAHSGVTLSVGAHPTIVGDECSGTMTVLVGPANQVTLSGVFPQYNQNTSTNTITLNECSDMTLTVPSQADLHLTADAITVFGVSGTMNLSVNGGRITLAQSTLQGQSKLDNNGGSTIFSGNLAQGSASDISGNSGSIDITLPSEATYNLHLTGIFGPFTSNIPGVQLPVDTTSDTSINVGGTPSYATLKLDLNDTAVVLRAGNG